MAFYYGVDYDATTLEPRRVIVPSDSSELFDGTHRAQVEHGWAFCTVARDQVAHLIPEGFTHPPDLRALAIVAIRLHTGREP
jgi:hypothetical protein